jgi:programmed cell death 8 (apoptosis-inducing factor)
MFICLTLKSPPQLWYVDEDEQGAAPLSFKQWNGKKRSLLFEPPAFYCRPAELPAKENGGVAVLNGHKVDGRIRGIVNTW